jgi:hypothetical protein
VIKSGYAHGSLLLQKQHTHTQDTSFEQLKGAKWKLE